LFSVDVGEPVQHVAQRYARLIKSTSAPVADCELYARLGHLLLNVQILKDRCAFADQVFSTLLRTINLFGTTDPSRQRARAQQHLSGSLAIETIDLRTLADSPQIVSHCTPRCVIIPGIFEFPGKAATQTDPFRVLEGGVFYLAEKLRS
jgi:hypothetical protein